MLSLGCLRGDDVDYDEGSDDRARSNGDGTGERSIRILLSDAVAETEGERIESILITIPECEDGGRSNEVERRRGGRKEQEEEGKMRVGKSRRGEVGREKGNDKTRVGRNRMRKGGRNRMRRGGECECDDYQHCDSLFAKDSMKRRRVWIRVQTGEGGGGVWIYHTPP